MSMKWSDVEKWGSIKETTDTVISCNTDSSKQPKTQSLYYMKKINVDDRLPSNKIIPPSLRLRHM